MKTRDEFSAKTKELAAKRVGYLCSHPDCRRNTVGASDEGNDRVCNVGVAAHICAAARGGKRYDPNMTSKQRSGIENCIWLCQTHAHLIDTDDNKYTVQLLREWKATAESYSKKLMESAVQPHGLGEKLTLQWRKNFMLDEWEMITGDLLRPYCHVMREKVSVGLSRANIWLSKNVHLLPQPIKLRMNVFSAVLKTLMRTFMSRAEKKVNFYQTAPYCKHGGKYADNDEFVRHNDEIWELTFELTKAANAVCKEARKTYNLPQFREKINLIYTLNSGGGYESAVIEYKPDEYCGFEFSRFKTDKQKRLFDRNS